MCVVCMCVCVNYIYMHIYIYTPHTHTHTHTHTHICICTYTYTYFFHTHTHTHTHNIYTQTWGRQGPATASANARCPSDPMALKAGHSPRRFNICVLLPGAIYVFSSRVQYMYSPPPPDFVFFKFCFLKALKAGHSPRRCNIFVYVRLYLYIRV